MNKNIQIGSWITLNHFSIAEILADSGFDWLCRHGTFCNRLF